MIAGPSKATTQSKAAPRHDRAFYLQGLGADPRWLTYRDVPIDQFVQGTMGIDPCLPRDLARHMELHLETPHRTPVYRDYVEGIRSATNSMCAVTAFAHLFNHVVQRGAEQSNMQLQMSNIIVPQFSSGSSSQRTPAMVSASSSAAHYFAQRSRGRQMSWKDVDIAYDFRWPLTKPSRQRIHKSVAQMDRLEAIWQRAPPMIDGEQLAVEHPSGDPELQLAINAHAKFKASIHLDFFIQVLMVREKMYLFCYDRGGVVVSEPLNWQTDHQATVAAILSLAMYCQTKIYNPTMRNSPCSNPHLSFLEELTWDTPIDGHDLPDIENNVPVEEVPEGKLFVDFGEEVYTEKSLFGRGTRVYEVKLFARNRNRFKLLWPGIKLVAKMSYQPSGKTHESEIIQHARAINPEHTPAVFAHKVIKGRLPSILMRQCARNPSSELAFGEIYEVLDLEIIIMRKYTHACNLPPAAFMAAFRDIVTCHRQIYIEGGIIHRDLSTANVMAFKKNDGAWAGILNDFDLSRIIGSNKPQTMDERVGTSAFMATELLLSQSATIPQSYIHDLESLFWVLATITLDREKKGACFINDWFKHEDPEMLYWAKRDFFNQEHVLLSFHKRASWTTQPLVLALISMQRLFKAGFARADRAVEMHPRKPDAKEKNEVLAKIAHEAFQQVVTWERFAQILTIPPETIDRLQDPNSRKSGTKVLGAVKDLFKGLRI